MTEIGVGKKKLTLSVDEAVVDKAKTLGLNLSEITEAVLRGFAFAPDKIEKDALYSKYRELLESMLPLLKEYDTSVKIAEDTIFDNKQMPMYTCDVDLLPDGTFWIQEVEHSFNDIHKIKPYNFLEPKVILSNFITAIVHAKEERKELLEELEMIKRIVSAITETTKSAKVSTSHPTTDKRKVQT